MRVALFAHYDRDAVVDDYVLYYLKELRKVCNRIVFVSDGDLPLVQQQRAGEFADKVIATRHGEYDFGSYKRGFQFAKQNGWLNDTSQLVLVNDSCYGPLFPLATVFDEMASVPVWGMTSNYWGIGRTEKCYHIQSFFMVFSCEVFLRDDFAAFLQAVEPQSDKREIIRKYEIGFSKWLTRCDIPFTSYIQSDPDCPNPFLRDWEKIFRRCHLPLIKVSKIRRQHTVKLYSLIGSHTDYPVGLILRHKQRIKGLSLGERIGIAFLSKRFKEHKIGQI